MYIASAYVAGSSLGDINVVLINSTLGERARVTRYSVLLRRYFPPIFSRNRAIYRENTAESVSLPSVNSDKLRERA